MTRKTSISRRRFVQAALGASLAGPSLISSLSSAAPGRTANGRINLGFIGVGVMGRGHVHTFANYPDVQIVAISDVVAERRQDGVKFVEGRNARRKDKGTAPRCTEYKDFRALLDRKDIDAVVFATPDHWHALACVFAARAGEDIYCEKPLTHAIAQGRRIVDAVNAHKVIFQTGSQQRSEFGGKFHYAAELVRNGRIGKVKTVRIGVVGPAVPCDLPEQPIPPGTDWEMWVGPAVFRPYNEILCPKGVHTHFPAWRSYREYGGGLADMGAHHFDIAQWALGMDESGPVKIDPPPGSETTGLKYTYANGIVMFHGGPSGCTFEGTEGTIYVDRDRLESKPEDIVKRPIGGKDVHLYRATDHHKNWIECIRNRKQPICPAELGQRSATICHLGNIGYRLRRSLRWDPVEERFIDDAEANKLVDEELRGPWKW